MLTCEPLALDAPALAIDMDSHTMCGLLYAPGLEAKDQVRFCLPSPEQGMVRSIREATAEGRALYFSGTGLGREAVRALLEHIRTGLPLCVHPETVRILCGSPDLLSKAGVTVSERRPSGAAFVHGLDYTPGFWTFFQAMSGLPRPEVVLVAAPEEVLVMESGLRELLGAGPASDSEAPLFSMHKTWCGKRYPGHSTWGVPVQDFFYAAAPPDMPRLAAIQRSTLAPVSDSFGAAMLGVLSYPSISSRSWREGILIVRLGRGCVHGALVFQGHCYGVFNRPFSGLGQGDIALLLEDLDSFRLGWLPFEKMAVCGGGVCMAPELPPEAEGFKPLFLTGPRAYLLKEHGKVVAAAPDCADVTGCWGLLHGYASMPAG